MKIKYHGHPSTLQQKYDLAHFAESLKEERSFPRFWGHVNFDILDGSDGSSGESVEQRSKSWRDIP